MLAERLKNKIAEVKDFPKPGIFFKDITPVLLDVTLSRDVISAFVNQAKASGAEYIAGIDARGFLFGMAVAQELQLPFVPLRKAGKLPREVHSQAYSLEYGEAHLTLHKNDIPAKAKVLIHDDLLATAGTAFASKMLVEKAGAEVCAFQFLVTLDFLEGAKKLAQTPVYSLYQYT